MMCAVLAAGCGTVPHGPAGGQALGCTAAGVTGAYFPATMSQIADGTDFQQTISTLEKELFEDCIRGYGFGPKAQAFAFQSLNLIQFQAISGYTANQQASVGLVDLQSISHSGMLAPVYFMIRPPDASGVPPAVRRAVEADRSHCWFKSLEPTRRLEREGFALQRQWYADEVRLLNSAQVRSANKVFKACVTHYGAPRTASESFGQFLNWLRQLVNRGEFGVRSGGVEPAVTPRKQIDAHWSAIFVKCGQPLAILMQRLLPVAQQAFMQGTSARSARWTRRRRRRWPPWSTCRDPVLTSPRLRDRRTAVPPYRRTAPRTAVPPHRRTAGTVTDETAAIANRREATRRLTTPLSAFRALNILIYLIYVSRKVW